MVRSGKTLIRPMRILVAAVLMMVLVAPAALAQYYFGKNKVQYTSFDWQVMTTDHFRIYFYTEEAQLARIAARLAETSYRVLAERFNHEVGKKIPLIIYSSPNYFSQTNVLSGLLPESVGGFTEFMKGRVVVPFNGRHADFAHVIRHELVHVFMLSRLDEQLSRRRRARFVLPPLWFTEGLAEFWSKNWDSNADMVVKDMILTNKLPSIPNMYRVRGTYYMYKLGESILHFVDSTYGPDKFDHLFGNWHKGRDFDAVVEATIGDDLKELSRKWEYWLKKKYYPQIARLDLPKMESRRLTTDGFSEKGVPIRWDNGNGPCDWIVYKGHSMGYAGIYMKPMVEGNKNVRTLLKGERSAAYESLHLLRSGIDANDSGLVVFSSKSKETDVLYIYDLNEGHVTGRFEFDDLVEARSPRLSPDGREVVFSGVRKDGFTDLYLLDLAGGDYEAVTDDMYYDADPTFTPDGRSLVYASDRCAAGADGALNLYEIDLVTRRIVQLTRGAYHDQTPECGPSGIYFSSNRGGTYNLFLRDDDGELTRQSAYITGAFDPRLAPGGDRLVYTGYQDMGYQVYEMDIPTTPEAVAQPGVAFQKPWEPVQIDREYSRSAVKYDTDYSFDIAQSAVGYDPVYGSLGGFQAAASDVLGNHAYYFLLTNTARTRDEFLESFNVGITYMNRERRLNWGVGLFHLFDEYYNDFDMYYFERQVGAVSLLSYPLSKFQRLDFTTLARYSNRESRFDINNREVFLVGNYVSFVYDNSLWDISGPIEGRRYRVAIGLTSSLNDMATFNRTALADFRHYFRLGKYSAFANRLFGFTSSGREPQRIYLGGSWSFRGYARRAFYNRNILFASTELRFPLIDLLAVGFPFGGFDFRGIRGALFFDTGSAWDDRFDDFVGSFGGGFRVALGYVVQLRFDFTRTTDFETISPNTDFDFFFGWNF
ncbi:MAG: PD40 domain-containing protein [candidate division Zixibacteria bacterium]|nr:PD40 domain-containing protein [candidate division Zixibacteria bacterium]